MNFFVFVLAFVVFVVDCALVNVHVNYLQTPDPADLSLVPGQLPPIGVQRLAALYINHRYQTLRQRLIQHKRSLWIYHMGQPRATRPNDWLQQRLSLLNGNTRTVHNEMKKKSRLEEENFSNEIKQIMINQLRQVDEMKETLRGVLDLPAF